MERTGLWHDTGCLGNILDPFLTGQPRAVPSLVKWGHGLDQALGAEQEPSRAPPQLPHKQPRALVWILHSQGPEAAPASLSLG